MAPTSCSAAAPSSAPTSSCVSAVSTRSETPDEYDKAWPEALEKAKQAVKAEHEEVTGLGGLYVLGTERHESRRIDNQLRGRSGRQGDPGESRFYLSLGDDLMRLFNSPRVEAIMVRMNIPDDQPIESGIVTKAVASAQHQVEQQNFEIRKNVLKYDEVMNRQRKVIYAERHRVLEGADLHEQVRGFVTDVIKEYVAAATAEGFSEEWDLDKLWKAFGELYPISLKLEDVVEEAGGREELSADLLNEKITADALAAYDRREEELGSEAMRELERRVILSVLDRKWREHLYEMDYLQEGIGLRAMAQRDPLIEYQREGFEMFSAMLEGIKEESVGYLFNLEVEVQENPIVEESAEIAETRSIIARGLRGPERPTQLEYTAPGEDGEVEHTSVPHHRRSARRLRQRRAQRAVPVRFGQEVQALPRRPQARRGITEHPKAPLPVPGAGLSPSVRRMQWDGARTTTGPWSEGDAQGVASGAGGHGSSVSRGLLCRGPPGREHGSTRNGRSAWTCRLPGGLRALLLQALGRLRRLGQRLLGPRTVRPVRPAPARRSCSRSARNPRNARTGSASPSW
ncbi:hypothetical protein GCM10020219_016040 [Nonomuraea dietziae]